MFEIAILIGTYSYLIFLIGIFSLLFKSAIIVLSLIFLSFSFAYLKFFSKKKISLNIKIYKNNFFLFLFFVLLLQILINLIGALGPEISFDALWYHLTIPKIFLQNARIFFIPGGLLYYSLMPKLTEMLYIAGLSLGGNYIFAKLIHFSFGILTLLAIYKITEKNSNKKMAILACLIFYSNLIVGWESTTAYIDLSRTFFEVMALWAFLLWVEKEKIIWLIESGTLLGLAVSSKVIALQSISIFLFLIFMVSIFYFKYSVKKTAGFLIIFPIISIFVPLPWFIFSYLNTHNLFYPLFTNYYKTSFDFSSVLNFRALLVPVWNLFMKNQDPVSPLYVMIIPIIFLTFKFYKKIIRVIFYYVILAVLICLVSFKSGGGRYILPYLPGFSILTAISINHLNKRLKLQKILIIMVLFISLISLTYRFIANKKYLPVIFKTEKSRDFLIKNLNFSFGDFFDTDNYFAKKITNKDKVLIFGVHNLFYVDFPFIHESWAKKGDLFNYVLVVNEKLPQRFINWNLIYENKVNHVKLYSLGGKMWEF